jgi:hypothetical protein
MYKKLVAKLKIKRTIRYSYCGVQNIMLRHPLRMTKRPGGLFVTTWFSYVKNKAEFDSLAPIAVNALKEAGIFWIAYPKVSVIKTNITP